MEKILEKILSLIQSTKSLDENGKNKWTNIANTLKAKNREKDLNNLYEILIEDKKEQDEINRLEFELSKKYEEKNKGFNGGLSRFAKSFLKNSENKNIKKEQNILDNLLDDINNA